MIINLIYIDMPNLNKKNKNKKNHHTQSVQSFCEIKNCIQLDIIFKAPREEKNT